MCVCFVAKVASAVPNQLSKLLPDWYVCVFFKKNIPYIKIFFFKKNKIYSTVSPPGRLERNAVLHVNSWVTVATSISGEKNDNIFWCKKLKFKN